MDSSGDAIAVFTEAQFERLLNVARRSYRPGLLDGTQGREVAEAELQQRHYWFRNRYVPWIQTITTLSRCRVLEVGSGAGSSTVAMAEAGAEVEALDVDPSFTELAELRADIIGVRDRVRFTTANSTDLSSLFSVESFDVVAFTASLEHMTFVERMASLRSAWSLIRQGGLLVVVDTPNRLWFYDGHTTFEHHFHWLPDDVAEQWARRKGHDGFTGDPPFETNVNLARHGRGVSYHDFTLALDEDILSFDIHGEWDYRRSIEPDWAKWWDGTVEGRFQALMREITPQLPRSFLEPEIAVAIRKPLQGVRESG